MVARAKETDGFAMKALIGLLGAILTVLIGFFIWLATAMVELKVSVAKMQVDITALSAARTVTTASEIQRNRARIEELERDKDGGK